MDIDRSEFSDTDMPSDYGTNSPLGVGIARFQKALKESKSIKIDGKAASYSDDDGIPIAACSDRNGFGTVIVLNNIFWMGVRGDKYTVRWWVDPAHYISGEAVVQVSANNTPKKDENKEV